MATPARDPESLTIRAARPEDHETLVGVWLRSVRATHTFLTGEDIDSMLPQMRGVAMTGLDLWVLCLAEKPVGFIGCAGEKIEALFLDPSVRRRGGGRMLVEHAKRRGGAVLVDVNEQNPEARRFYEAMGFVVESRSPLDSEGRPFPILHMRQASI